MLVGVVLTLVAVLLPWVPLEAAAPPKSKPLTAVCVDKADDSVRVASPCGEGERKWNLRMNRRNVFCVYADGSLRKIPSGSCTGRVLKMPKVEPLSFCAAPHTGLLRLVDKPGACTPKEKRYVVADRPPTAPTLSSAQVDENAAANTVVGTLASKDPDIGDRPRFHLVGGPGSQDNARFRLDGKRLLLRAAADHEVTPTLRVRVEARDRRGLGKVTAFAVTVRDVNEPPSALGVTPATVAAYEVAKVGVVSATDPDAGDHLSYAVVSGPFEIRGGHELWTSSALTDTVNVTLRATDSGGLSVDRTQTITVVKNNRPPTAPTLGHDHVDENSPVGTVVGALSATDPDPGDSLTFSLASGAGSDDNAAFAVSGSSLRTAEVLDFEDQDTYSVRVRVADAAGLAQESSFTIHADDVNDAPTDLEPGQTDVDENRSIGSLVAALTADDQDAGDSLSFGLVAGAGDADNAAFFVVGNHLVTAAVLDHEAAATRTVRVRATDSGGLSVERAITVTVNDVNEAPTALSPGSATVLEHQPSGLEVATLGATDPDAGDTHTFTLVSGTGDDDNALFAIDGGVLETAAVLDHATTPTLTVRVRATDSGGLFFESPLTITVDDVNDAPTGLDLSATTVAENEPSGTTVGGFTAVDADGAPPFTFELVAGAGDTDNGSFTVTGSTLETAAAFDFETKSTYSIRAQVTDAGGLSFQKVFTIGVTDVNEAPSGPALTGDHVAENQPVGTTVGTLSSTDPDSGDTATYTLVGGAGGGDNASFAISGTTLRTAAVFDFEAKDTYAIRVRVTDAGGLTSETALTVHVDDVNDPPVAGDDSFTGAIGNTTAVAGTWAVSGPKSTLTGTLPLANDTDQDGDALAVVESTLTTTRGGSVTIDAAGNFRFEPHVGDVALTDSFTYTVSDGDLTDTGTVQVAIGQDLVWYVDAAAAAPGAGTSVSPLTSLTPLNGPGDLDASLDTIFVYGNPSPYATSLTLEVGQALVGQSVGLRIGTQTLVAPSGTNPTITPSSGASLVLAEGADVFGITADRGATATSVANASFDTASRLAATGADYALAISGGSGTIEVNGNITSGRALSVSGRSGSVTLTGSVTGRQVSLSNNTGSTTFSGGLTLDAGATGDAGLTATSGGTLVVTGAANSVTTTTGTSVSLVNTTIGTGGVTFRSVSANGATNGIRLSNTGTSGSFAVTGSSGTACGTGTLADCTGGALLNTSGSAVVLDRTRAPGLNRLRIAGSGADGISATDVTNGLTISNSYLSGNGNAADEDGIDLGGSTASSPSGWVGAATIDRTTVTGSYDSNVVAGNASGLATLAVTDSTLSHAGSGAAATAKDGLQVRALGTATVGVTATGSTYSGNLGDHVQIVASDAALLSPVTVTNNTMTGGTAGALGQGVIVAASGLPWTGSATFNVSNNLIIGAASSAIVVSAVGTSSGSQFRGHVDNNSIGSSDAVKSCSRDGSGIRVVARDGAGTAVVTASNNVIRRCADRGIDVVTGAGANTLALTARGNTTTTNPADHDAPNGLTRQGFYANVGVTASDTATSCLDVRQNSFQTGTSVSMGLFVQHRYGGLALPGYGGSSTSGAAAATYLAGLNPGTATVQASDPITGTYTGPGSACAQP